jgi:hypothetical protein
MIAFCVSISKSLNLSDELQELMTKMCMQDVKRVNDVNGDNHYLLLKFIVLEWKINCEKLTILGAKNIEIS